jgi:hypothetical protein
MSWRFACRRPRNDLHATVLAALGIDQRDLFFDHHGRREIATVNGGRVIDRVFA